MGLFHTTYRATTTTAAGVLLLAVLTGCSDDPDANVATPEDGEETSEGSSSPASEEAEGAENAEVSEAADEEDAPEADVGAAGGALTQQQVDAALPTLDDLPSGWSQDPEETDDSADTVQPQACAIIGKVLEPGPAADAAPQASGSRDFVADGFQGVVSVEVNSFADPIGDDLLPAVEDALAQCADFTVTEEGGRVSEMSADGLTFPDLGEESVAFQLSTTQDGLAFTSQVVFVRVGHNSVTAFAIDFTGGSGTELLEDVTRTTIQRLAG